MSKFINNTQYEAVLYNGSNFQDIIDFLGTCSYAIEASCTGKIAAITSMTIYVNVSGTQKVNLSISSWLLRDPKGDYFSVSDEKFKERYSIVTE